MEIKDINLGIRKQLSVIIANLLNIEKGIVQTESMVYQVQQRWFKPMISVGKQIYYVFHPTSAQMCEFLT